MSPRNPPSPAALISAPTDQNWRLLLLRLLHLPFFLLRDPWPTPPRPRGAQGRNSSYHPRCEIRCASVSQDASPLSSRVECEYAGGNHPNDFTAKIEGALRVTQSARKAALPQGTA